MIAPKVVDLFCGCGGFGEGFRQAGFDVILGIDNNFLAAETFRLNHECNVICQDIMLPFQSMWDIDVVIGSPPCPHFSVANRNFNQPPDMQFVERFLQLVDTIKPKYWVMENVVGVLDYIPAYKQHSQILQANWFGLHHKRERVFVGKFPKVAKTTPSGDIWYPTPMAADDHVHCSKNNPNISCLSDYFKFSPDVDVFKKIVGFPYDYIFVGKKKDQIRQIGNAVCPPVAKEIAEAIMKEIKNE